VISERFTTTLKTNAGHQVLPKNVTDCSAPAMNAMQSDIERCPWYEPTLLRLCTELSVAVAGVCRLPRPAQRAARTLRLALGVGPRGGEARSSALS